MYWTMTGDRVRLKVGNQTRSFFPCRCICGKEKLIAAYSLKINGSLSCGCVNKNSLTHGMSLTGTYKSWSEMKNRCLNAKHKHYKDYGGRGIKIYERWLKFNNFYEDMGTRPKDRSLDRIDNSGNYEQSNCRWADIFQQANNKRNTLFYNYRGKRLSLSQISKLTGIKRKIIWQRITRDKMNIYEATKK